MGGNRFPPIRYKSLVSYAPAFLMAAGTCRSA
jgi:hypothetical protein